MLRHLLQLVNISPYLGEEISITGFIRRDALLTKRQPSKPSLLATKRSVRDGLTCAPWSPCQNNTTPFPPCIRQLSLPISLPSPTRNKPNKERGYPYIQAPPHLALLIIIEPGAWSNKSRLCLRHPGEKEAKRRGIATARSPPPSLSAGYYERGM